MGETNPAVPPPPPSGPRGEHTSTRVRRAELRQHPRFRTDEDAAARLYIRGFLTKLGLGLKNEAQSAVNLSQGGALILTHSKLKPGTKVKVKIEIEKYNDLIETDGEVRWCFQSAREENDFYAGIQFSDLPAGKAALISKMHSWYTSPEYKQKSATRRRLGPPDLKK
jgi:hypothetical protein